MSLLGKALPYLRPHTHARRFVSVAIALALASGHGSAQSGDSDGDGLSNECESLFGLNPASAASPNGAADDPDGDGKSNLQECLAGTHPRGTFVRYFAEGATSGFFDTRIALANPGPTAARVLLRFLKGDGTTGSHVLQLPAYRQATVNAKTVPGLAEAEFSTIVESDQTIAIDRTMTWDASRYGSHADTAVVAPSTTWYLAEGSTVGGFSLFYLLQNPSDQPTAVSVTYLLPVGAPLSKTYVIGANSRFNIWVNQETFPGVGTALASTAVSAIITVLPGGQPIIVERAMYLNGHGQTFSAGHESAGVIAPALNWFLAEGATGSYFDEFVLIANPTSSAALVQASFLLPSGTVYTKQYTVTCLANFGPVET